MLLMISLTVTWWTELTADQRFQSKLLSSHYRQKPRDCSGHINTVHLFIDSCIAAGFFFFPFLKKLSNTQLRQNHVTVRECVTSTKSWQPATWHRNLVSVVSVQCLWDACSNTKLTLCANACVFCSLDGSLWCLLLLVHSFCTNLIHLSPVFTLHSREARGDQHASLYTSKIQIIFYFTFRN